MICHLNAVFSLLIGVCDQNALNFRRKTTTTTTTSTRNQYLFPAAHGSKLFADGNHFPVESATFVFFSLCIVFSLLDFFLQFVQYLFMAHTYTTHARTLSELHQTYIMSNTNDYMIVCALSVKRIKKKKINTEKTINDHKRIGWENFLDELLVLLFC